MAVISVVGTSGVGKSFLVKQLSSKMVLPAFFEGEEGTIPPEILCNIFSRGDPVQRYNWFLYHYRIMLERARRVSDSGLDCIVDGAVMSAEAILIAEGYFKHPEFLKKVETIMQLQSDKVILLTASKQKLKQMILARGRSSEATAKAIKRAWGIQQEFLKLARKDKRVLVIDRTKLDFTNEKDLHQIEQILKEKKNRTFIPSTVHP